jgi:polyhydroxyalkanoate synthesis repressor PhaR
MVTVKKYSNRRLYDTAESRYVTLDELAAKIRTGEDARVVDAKTGEDLTQATLAQIILESRGAGRLLPIPLLMQLIRMGDDALAEFFGRYMTLALELYFQAKQGAQAMAPYNPFATLPFSATNALARVISSVAGWGEQTPPPPAPPQAAGHSGHAPSMGAEHEVAAMRRELDELKQSLRKKKR